MTLSKFIDKSLIEVNLASSSKEEAISKLVDRIDRRTKIVDKKKVLDELLEREKGMSTGIGEGVALPHVRTSNVSKISIALGISKEGIEFNSFDGKPAHLIFLLLGPNSDNENYLTMMAQITKLVCTERKREKLLQARDPKEVIQFIIEMEAMR
ncbi:MAG: PTS sugar transporter subunit IIA [bacterium]